DPRAAAGAAPGDDLACGAVDDDDGAGAGSGDISAAGGGGKLEGVRGGADGNLRDHAAEGHVEHPDVAAIGADAPDLLAVGMSADAAGRRADLDRCERREAHQVDNCERAVARVRDIGEETQAGTEEEAAV